MSNPTRTQAIKGLLAAKAPSDLAALYNFNMECQVNVAQDGGERVDGEFRGRKWHGWTNGIQTWKAFRIPYGAGTDDPNYKDIEMSFDLEAHAEGIGMTGWDWVNKVSRWVAFDFDAIVGHSEAHEKKLTPEELSKIQNAAVALPYVTTRRSAGGSGLHLYVFLDPPVETKNHHEHAALARSILGQMAAETAHDFAAKVDVCGGNMWVWHRKANDKNQGLQILKSGTPLKSVPINWRDHVNVVTNRKRRATPQFVSDDKDALFESLCGMYPHVELDDEHRQLMNYLNDTQALWWWDADRRMIVCHTADLKRAHTDLKMRGIFETMATGQEHGADQNCFGFPLSKGAWAIRRHTPGCNEHSSWEQDGSGWTRTFLNREPDLRSAARSLDGVENEKGAYVFSSVDKATLAVEVLGAKAMVPEELAGQQRETHLNLLKDGRVVIKIKKQPAENTSYSGWLTEKNYWVKITDARGLTHGDDEKLIGNFDSQFRHIVIGDADCGWVLFGDGNWRQEPLTHIQKSLKNMGYSATDSDVIIGKCVLQPWYQVNIPFDDEYPGERKWNRGAAQLAYTPNKNEDRKYPTWSKLLSHVGESLDPYIKRDGWCKVNGVLTGADYLKIWIASIFQSPFEPLPFLFLYGPQNSGKSSLHEALSLLITKGVIRADLALKGEVIHNAELENAVICVIEETDLGKDKKAAAKIKDWVTSRELNIRKMHTSPYLVPNTTHWIQCANDHRACPIFPGDTRITMMYVDNLELIDLIPKRDFIELLKKEAPDFLGEILQLEIPDSNDRLNLPVINTSEKTQVEQLNESLLEEFIRTNCYKVAGEAVLFAEFFDKFREWCPDPNDLAFWSKIRIGRELPPEYPRGRATWDNNKVYVGNLSWENKKPTKPKFQSIDDVLRRAFEDD